MRAKQPVYTNEIKAMKAQIDSLSKKSECSYCRKASHELTCVENATMDMSLIYVCNECLETILKETPEAKVRD